jgi:hypothetical protein
MGTLNLVSSGKLFHEAFIAPGTPAGFTEQKTGGGTLNYGGKLNWICSAGDLAYLRYDTALPYPEYCLRCYVHPNTVAQNSLIMVVYDSAAPGPAGAQAISGGGTNKPMMVGYASSALIAFYNNATEGNPRDPGFAGDVNRVVEILSDAVNVRTTVRNATTLAVETHQVTRAWGSAEIPSPVNNLYVTIGNTWNIGWGGDHDAEYIQGYVNNNIVVANLGVGSGRGVRLYDVANNLIAQGVEAGAGTVTLDATLCDFNSNPDPTTGGFNGYINIYTDGTYGTQMGSDARADYWGGSTLNWVQSTPTITSITPNTGVNTGPINITDLAGTNFEHGATVELLHGVHPTITASAVNVVSNTQITCTFDLTGAPAGFRNVRVTNIDGGTVTLLGAFAVTNPAPTLSAITPNTANNAAPVNITNLAGTGFLAGAITWLQRPLQPNINGTGVVVVGPNQITCTFNLTGVAVGAWDVHVQNTDGQNATLAGGFTVTSAIPPLPPIGPPMDNTWDVAGWSSNDPAGTPRTGRAVAEDGSVIQLAFPATDTGETDPVPVHATGRMLREDSTTANIANLLGG